MAFAIAEFTVHDPHELKDGVPTVIFDAPLPDFERPPLKEVVLAVQFSDLTDFDLRHYGMLAERLESELPDFQQKGRLEPSFERFSTDHTVPPRFKIMDEPEPPRAWFLSSSGQELVQVQSDRFLFNWRKLESEKPYPRYEYVKNRFFHFWKIFQKFCVEKELGEIEITQCEVAYINEIDENKKPLSSQGNVNDVLSFWKSNKKMKSIGLDETEAASANIHYIVRNDNAEPFARLHVNIEPRARYVDNSKIIRLAITFRGKPDGSGINNARKFHDIGHEYIVRAFKDLTSTKAHKCWGLKNG